MYRQSRLTMFALIGWVTLIAFCVVIAREVETSFGKVRVQIVHLDGVNDVKLVGKLYIPATATIENPSPAVLALHGFQNDKETQDAFAIELSRRGFVVLALDQYGHGSSGGNMALNEQDPTLGGDTAYQYLKTLPYVNGSKLGTMGHSMGAVTALAVAEINPDHRAVNSLCGPAGNPGLNNVLLSQARFEEFLGFRENQPTTKGLTADANRLAAFGLEGEVAWDQIYGSFGDGSARMQTLINTVHAGATHSRKAVAEAIVWMNNALNDGLQEEGWIDPNKQVFMWKEISTLFAMLFSLASLIPLTNLLLGREYFAVVTQSLPDVLTTNRPYAASERSWRRYALVNNLIAGLTFPILTGVGGSMLVSLVPSFSMIIANGVATWFLGNALIYLLIFMIWYLRNRKKLNVTLFNMGISFDEEKMVVDWRILGRTVLLGMILLGWLYLLVFLSQRLAGIEFRFLWPFMREFSLPRFANFWIYLLPAVLFFLLNGGVFLFGQARRRRLEFDGDTQLSWWWHACLASLSGLAVVWAFQYIPFFLGYAPGFELVGLPMLSGMIPLMLIVYIPEFAVLLYYLTWFYRRTGRIYLGAWVIASLAVWWLVAGTGM